ncbi:MAG: hypothetical protein UT02_C0059G0002 [Parcubacteria group bacterium GW2011_GWC2_38_7]|nr:MAG: hypothetical protein UT02_C0059G0002 [Parcubacteria group bacterium GW2011_GWC2_38_7]
MLVHFYRFLEKFKSSPGRKNRTLIICTIISFFLNLFIWLLIFFRLRPIVRLLPADQAFIPLHYNTYLGVDKFGDWLNIFILPGLGLLILLVNTLFAVLIYNRKDMLSYFLVITSLFSQLLFLIATIFIILINI